MSNDPIQHADINQVEASLRSHEGGWQLGHTTTQETLLPCSITRVDLTRSKRDKGLGECKNVQRA